MTRAAAGNRKDASCGTAITAAAVNAPAAFLSLILTRNLQSATVDGIDGLGRCCIMTDNDNGEGISTVSMKYILGHPISTPSRCAAFFASPWLGHLLWVIEPIVSAGSYRVILFGLGIA